MIASDWEYSHHERQILDNIERFGCHIVVDSALEDDFTEFDLEEALLGDDDENGNLALSLNAVEVVDASDEDQDEDGPEPEQFAYSVGFTETVNQPEVIVFGFSPDLSASVINGVLDLCKSGFVMEDWKVIEGLLQGHRCVLREVELENLIPHYFNAAIWHAEQKRGKPFNRAFQIVWPGIDDGLMPWDKGCSEVVRESQTPLYRTSLNS